jgi:hypothetical protein
VQGVGVQGPGGAQEGLILTSFNKDFFLCL